MSILTKNYVRLKKKFYSTESLDFSKILNSYDTVLIHPVMETGREVFCLPAIENLIKHRGKEKVEVLINEKSKFFFKDITAKKIYYKDFASPLSANYRIMRENLNKRKYDIFIELNRFNDEMLSLFALASKSKLRICLTGCVDNPIFNLVISPSPSRSEIERNNSFLKFMGIKKIKKKIEWKKGTRKRGRRKDIGIAISNHRIALTIFSFLKRRNFNPLLIVNEKRIKRLKNRYGENITAIERTKEAYQKCASCSLLITSVNDALSMGFLLKKKMLLILEGKERFIPSPDNEIKVFSLNKNKKFLLDRLQKFIEGK
jgi:hypothetical protein